MTRDNNNTPQGTDNAQRGQRAVDHDHTQSGTGGAHAMHRGHMQLVGGQASKGRERRRHSCLEVEEETVKRPVLSLKNVPRFYDGILLDHNY